MEVFDASALPPALPPCSAEPPPRCRAVETKTFESTLLSSSSSSLKAECLQHAGVKLMGESTCTALVTSAHAASFSATTAASALS